MKEKQWIQLLAMVSQIGITMSVTLIGCILMGNWIDERLNTTPCFLLIFTILGIGASFRNLFFMTQKMKRKDKKHE